MKPEREPWVRSLMRGWAWILGTAVLSAVVTTVILVNLPPVFQSQVELRLTDCRMPVLGEIGLDLRSESTLALLMSAEVRRQVGDEPGDPPLVLDDSWTADDVSAVTAAEGVVYIVVRDPDPELAARTANALEQAARRVQRRRLAEALREVAADLETERAAILERLEAGEVADTDPTIRATPLELDLRRVRRQTLLQNVVDLEWRLDRVRAAIDADRPGWTVVEPAAPKQHTLRQDPWVRAIPAVLLPTVFVALLWVMHDRRRRP